MSHPRIRKAAVAGDGTRGRVPLAKAAGDAANDLNSIVCTNQPPRARSKNKLPKSLRYDLENALVGLCDVWFENIKPHLIRNNIKLHVHEGAAAAEASGDHEQLPPGAPGCSHIDPGAAPDRRRLAVASCVGSSQTRPPASRARCRKQPASLARPPQIHSPSNEKKSRARKRRKGTSASQPPNWRVPRLCRTYSALPPVATPRNQQRIRTASPTQTRTPKPYTHYTTNHKRKEVYRNKSTQTEWPSNTKCKPLRRTPLQPPLFTRYCYLYFQDLISIISEKHDKRLKLLFKSPTRDEVPSVMNLARSPCDLKRNSCPKKVQP
ncbi:hypothetical protein K1T71_001835 [Dendrolimus kikuchii]|uniref:Uncharacterized protein n=1 Tax=Dendrolimus kikuchii TaxID=765133 RepID=A0ACC1DF70_9NEOP|nr:hypothetical protein K1T71_001835 [Dendrolimus kikuchii]